jgi:response regulator of citrate/malate metabolism
MNTPSLLNSKPRVLIVDNNDRVKNVYMELVNYWGYEPVLANGVGKDLLQDAKSKIREKRCQLALVDLRLVDDWDDEDDSGLAIVPQLKPAICFIVSASVDIENIRRSDEVGAATYIGKGEGPNILKEKLEREARKICSSEKNVTIEPQKILEHISKTLCKDVPVKFHDQIKDIFVRLFPNASKLHLERLGASSETLTYSSVPRPRSVILLVYENNKQPVIVKLARAHKMSIEIERFQKHIQGYLKGHFHPNISNPIILWDIGGAIYTSLGSTNSHTFTKFYNEATFADIEHSITHFFSRSWSPLYAEAKQCKNVSLFEEYCKVWGDEWYQRICDFKVPKPQEVMETDTLKEMQPIDPIAWFKENIGDKLSEDKSIVSETALAVTHGDLHGDNLLIDENQNAWVIDFERSGEGHILQDFVELEGDILNRLISSNKNLPSFHKLCIKISQDKEIQEFDNWEHFGIPEVEKALQTISLLRKLARQCTAISDARQYLLGLLFNTLFRATITGDTAFKLSQQRALMLASIICHRLDHWDDPWPPEEWRKL